MSEKENPLIENESTLVSDEELKPDQKKKNSYIRYILNIVLVLVVTGVSFAVSFFSDLDEIITGFRTVNWYWILAAFGLVIFALLTRALIYLCFARLYTRKYHYHQGLAIDNIGTFYNAVTPGASGGQFMQAYTYKKQGLPISAGASIMVMASVVHQFVLIILGIFALVFESKQILGIRAFNIFDFNIPIMVFIVLGFTINVAFIALLLLMSYSRKFHHFILGPCINLLVTIRLVKNPDKTRENLRIQVENFKIELKRLLSNIPFTILITILYFIALCCTFTVPCFVGKSLGASYEVDMSSVWDSIFYSNFHQMVTGLIPIPGSAGVSEYFFQQLFDSYFNFGSISLVSVAQIIWRLLTFTIPLVYAGFVTAFYRASPKEQVQERNINRQTFVALQRETYIERKQSADTLYETTRLTRQAIMSSLKKRNKKEKEEKARLKALEKEKIKYDKQFNKDNSNIEQDNLKSNHPFNNSKWNEIDIGDD